jgi:hypothetical protein
MDSHYERSLCMTGRTPVLNTEDDASAGGSLNWLTNRLRPKKEKRSELMKTDPDDSLRQHLVELLKGGSAHARVEEAIAGIPAKLRGQKPAGLPHSPWMLLEHLRIAQSDILQFSCNRKHKSPEWPKGYWPRSEVPPSAAAWNTSVRKFRQELKTMQNLVANPKTDLYARIPWGDGQTILREALLLADHNAYHVAQLVNVRRVLGIWPEK